MSEKLAMRSEVPVQETWDLSLIYKTQEDMYADVEKVKSISKELTEDYKGKLDTPEAIVACLDKYGEFYKRPDLPIATQVCRRVETEGQATIEDWKKALRAGGTLTPVEFAALAGVDITTDDALLDTIEIVGSYIDEICKLTKELNHDSRFCKNSEKMKKRYNF